jgi:hypothetical protein
VSLIDDLAQLAWPGGIAQSRGMVEESERGSACGLNPREDLRPYRQSVPFIGAECCRLVVQEIPDRAEQVGHAGNPRIGNAFDRVGGDSFKRRNQEHDVVVCSRAQWYRAQRVEPHLCQARPSGQVSSRVPGCHVMPLMAAFG